MAIADISRFDDSCDSCDTDILDSEGRAAAKDLLHDLESSLAWKWYAGSRGGMALASQSNMFFLVLHKSPNHISGAARSPRNRLRKTTE